MIGVKNVMRKLKTEGVDKEIQKRLDKQCVVPHIHPRSHRNDKDNG